MVTYGTLRKEIRKQGWIAGWLVSLFAKWCFKHLSMGMYPSQSSSCLLVLVCFTREKSI